MLSSFIVKMQTEFVLQRETCERYLTPSFDKNIDKVNEMYDKKMNIDIRQTETKGKKTQTDMGDNEWKLYAKY